MHCPILGSNHFGYWSEEGENKLDFYKLQIDIYDTSIVNQFMCFCAICIWLFFVCFQNSAEMAKFWIAFKVFAVMMSLFLVTASFNVSLITKVATLCALLTDLLSSYFIRILYPELDKMSKFIVMVDPEPTKL